MDFAWISGHFLLIRQILIIKKWIFCINKANAVNKTKNLFQKKVVKKKPNRFLLVILTWIRGQNVHDWQSFNHNYWEIGNKHE